MSQSEINSDTIRVQDMKITEVDGNVMVFGHGDNRFVTYEELVKLAESDDPVTIR